jgi:transcriptional regulator of arginine metabolism
MKDKKSPMRPNTKYRQDALKQLLTSHEVEDQQTLIELMKRQYGIDASQAAISRDLRALGISKRKVKNKIIYEPSKLDPNKEILRLAVVDVQHNNNLIVIHTLPGLADFVGDYLDMHDDIGILGTIAGENTLFVAPKEIKDMKHIYNNICKFLYIKEE